MNLTATDMTADSMTNHTPDQSLDLSGLKCPLPVLKARRAIKDMAAGSLLEVLADDPAAELDFAHFCETGGHELLETSRNADGDAFMLRFLIRAGAN